MQTPTSIRTFGAPLVEHNRRLYYVHSSPGSPNLEEKIPAVGQLLVRENVEKHTFSPGKENVPPSGAAAKKEAKAFGLSLSNKGNLAIAPSPLRKTG